jgi:hypothetical protein
MHVPVVAGRRRFLRQLLFLAKHGDVPAYGFRAVPVMALLFMAVAIAASMGFSYFIAIFVSGPWENGTAPIARSRPSFRFIQRCPVMPPLAWQSAGRPSPH